MTLDQAAQILARRQKHNNGLRTLRECGELAGIDYDTASMAQIIVDRARMKLTAISDQFSAAARDAAKDEDEGASHD